MQLIVTGGAGFIGSHLVDALIAQDHEVIVVDNLSTGRADSVNRRSRFCHMDICSTELESAFRGAKADAVIHLAAQTSVSGSWADPMQDARANILGTMNVLNSSIRHGIRRVVFASSAAVYGDPSCVPIAENAALAPISPYAVSKCAGEQYLRVISSQYGIGGCALRFSNVYGPRQIPGGEAGVVSIFADSFVHHSPVKVFGDGSQSRDFIYVLDVVSALVKAVQVPVAGAINIGTGHETSVLGLYDVLRRCTGSDPGLEFRCSRPGDIRHSRLDNSKAIRLLEWQPTVTIEEGIAKIVATGLAASRYHV